MSQRYLGGVITANPTAPTMTTESGVWTLEQQFQYTNTWSPKIVGNSLRFRSSALAYLNRTPSGSGSTTTATFSIWVKRGALGSTQAIFACERSSASDGTTIWFDSSDKLNVGINASGGATNGALVTTQVFRDPSAWYHIVAAIDTTQGTAANRMLLYVNGVQVTAFTTNTNPTQNSTIWVGTASLINHIGRVASSPTWFFDGYLAEYNVINGQQLTPSSFGAFDSTGVWQPLPYTGTYGTNGFYLTFADNSGTTATTLGKDYSGNGNNWTPNNFSLTAGVTYDWMLDSPTNYPGTSTGIGNYPVLNPIGSSTPAVVPAISNANLTAAYNRSSNNSWSPATMTIPSSSKWYWEWTNPTSSSTNLPYAVCGVIDVTCDRSQQNPTVYRMYQPATGNKVANTTSGAYGTAGALTDTFGCAVDMDSGKIYFSKNGTWLGSADPVAGTNAAYTDLVSTGVTWVPAFWFAGDLTGTVNINFGQRPFAYTPPTGFKALNTQNLSSTTIMNGAQYMAATTYTGNGSTLTVTNGGNNTLGTTFKPDFVWVKDRTGANNHCLFDSVRGVYILLNSNATAADQTFSTSLTSFNSNGFSLGNYGNVNLNSSSNYIAWQWQAGQGTTSSNTSGSITSTVSVNTTAGFSVVTFTAQSSGTGTVGHGLGVAPSMYIVKPRANVGGWNVYHSSLGASKVIGLNGTAAAGTYLNTWNNTAPTSTVFSLGTDYAAFGTQVAYCWAAVAGYSAFGSYTGNGSADGPFVYCGFRPRWILIKNASTSVDNWVIEDSSRDTYNPEQTILIPNTSGAESANSVFAVDFVSNGFKVRGTSTSFNGSGNTMIYAAFAENPFKIARAR